MPLHAVAFGMAASQTDHDIGGWERGAIRPRTFGDCLHRPYFISKMEGKGFIQTIEFERERASAGQLLRRHFLQLRF